MDNVLYNQRAAELMQRWNSPAFPNEVKERCPAPRTKVRSFRAWECAPLVSSHLVTGHMLAAC